MTDTVNKLKRSEIMFHITGKETKPEIMVRKYLLIPGDSRPPIPVILGHPC